MENSLQCYRLVLISKGSDDNSYYDSDTYMIYYHTVSLKNILSGLSILGSSLVVDPRNNRFQATYGIIPAYLLIEVQIRKENIFLWDSNSPLHISV